MPSPTAMLVRTSARRAFGLVEVSLAVLILALGVPPLVDLARSVKQRGISDEARLLAHFGAREALLAAVEAGKRDGFEPREASEDGVEIRVEPVAEQPGLWRVTARAGTVATLSMLAADPRVPLEEGS